MAAPNLPATQSTTALRTGAVDDTLVNSGGVPTSTLILDGPNGAFRPPGVTATIVGSNIRVAGTIDMSLGVPGLLDWDDAGATVGNADPLRNSFIGCLSSTGDDDAAYLGTSLNLARARPWATVAAYQAARVAGGRDAANSPDMLLLKRGDTLPGLGNILSTLGSPSGYSPTEPFIISSYGTASARPICRGLKFQGSGMSNVFIENIDASDANPLVGTGETACVNLTSCDHVTVQNVRLNKSGVGLQNCDSITLRNLSVSNCWDVWPLYYSETGVNSNIVVDGCIFDIGGWNPLDTVTYPIHSGAHLTYIHHSNDGATLWWKNSIFSRGSSGAMDARPGGHFWNNFCPYNMNGYQTGYVVHPEVHPPTDVQFNVFYGFTEASGGGSAIVLGNPQAGIVYRNLAINPDGSAMTLGSTFLQVNTFAAPNDYCGPIDARENVVWGWQGSGDCSAYKISAGPTTAGQHTIRDNRTHIATGLLVEGTGGAALTNNAYHRDTNFTNAFYLGGVYYNESTWPAASGETGSTYAPITVITSARTVRSYMESFGNSYTAGAPGDAEAFQDFIDRAMANDRATWDRRWTAGAINDYFRQGFEIAFGAVL